MRNNTTVIDGDPVEQLRRLKSGIVILGYAATS
jgi:hypothetical protein